MSKELVVPPNLLSLIEEYKCSNLARKREDKINEYICDNHPTFRFQRSDGRYSSCCLPTALFLPEDWDEFFAILKPIETRVNIIAYFHPINVFSWQQVEYKGRKIQNLALDFYQGKLFPNDDNFYILTEFYIVLEGHPFAYYTLNTKTMTLESTYPFDSESPEYLNWEIVSDLTPDDFFNLGERSLYDADKDLIKKYKPNLFKKMYPNE